jgi:hypothetical protein
MAFTSHSGGKLTIAHMGSGSMAIPAEDTRCLKPYLLDCKRDFVWIYRQAGTAETGEDFIQLLKMFVILTVNHKII